MQITPTLKAALLASTIALTGSSCKPTQEKHRDDVKRILESIHPSEEVIIASHNYYDRRDDLKNLTSDEKKSLTLSHARLSVLLEQIRTWGISIQSLLTILKSHERIITDENTKLKISANFWKDIGFLSCRGDELLLRTESYSPDRILRNFSTEVKMDGGELTVSFSWIEFETKAREDKERLSASTGVVEKWPATYTITIGLVLAK